MTEAGGRIEQLDDGMIQVTLPPSLTIASSSALYEQLAGIVESTSVVVFEAGAVDKVDTAGLQLLVAFTHERRDQSLLTELRGVPAHMHEAMTLLGVHEHLV